MKKPIFIILSFILVGCSNDLTGTYTGNQTISSSFGGSEQSQITMNVTDDGQTVSASIVTQDGRSNANWSAEKIDGERLGNANLTLTQNATFGAAQGGNNVLCNINQAGTGSSTSFNSICTITDRVISCTGNSVGGSNTVQGQTCTHSFSAERQD